VRKAHRSAVRVAVSETEKYVQARLKTLGGPYFTDELADLGSKDCAMQTRGVWII
jgi:hypothetical protein